VIRELQRKLLALEPRSKRLPKKQWRRQPRRSIINKDKKHAKKPRQKIAVDIGKQSVTAFDETKVFAKFDCIACDSSHPTPKSPKGKPFHIRSKHELYHSKEYDVDMNHAMFFTDTGEALHEYDGPIPWSVLKAGKSVTDFVGSHGCVRLDQPDAKTLFEWVSRKNERVRTTEVEVS
jgi:lipoprotein-anchoring transpeptidase ErfK/SrfK